MYERLVIGFYLACGALLLFLSTIIWRENPKSRVNRATAFMLGFAGLGPVFAAIGYTLPPAAFDSGSREPFFLSLQYFWELFFPFLLLFSLEFPVRQPMLQRHPRLRLLIFVPHVFHLVLMVALARGRDIAQWAAERATEGPIGWTLEQFSRGLTLSSILFDYLIDVHVTFFSAVNLAYVIGALIFLQRSQRTLTAPRMVRQVRVLMWGLRVALGLYVLAYIAPILGVVDVSETFQLSLLMIALLVGSGGVVYAIIRHQFLDVRLIARQSIVYSVTSALLVGLYILIVGQLSTWLRQQVGRPVPILDAGFIILAVIFFQPIMSQVEDWMQRFFLRDRTDYRRLMERFSTEIIRIVDLRQLQQQVISTLQDDLMIETAILVQVTRTPLRLRFYSLSRMEGDYGNEDATELLNLVDQVHVPVYYETLVTQAGNSHVWSVLAGFKPYLLVPLRAGQELAGFLLLSRKASAYRYTQEDFTVLHVLSNQVAVALANAALYNESLDKRRLEEELAVARQIQMALLPEHLPRSDHFEVDAFTRPAREVGGDFYDFFPIPDGRLGMVIGDASGKSIPAALVMAQLQAVLKNEARTGGSPTRIMDSLNRCAFAGSQSDRFVTMVYGELEPESGRFRYCNAGHNYPILTRGDGSYQSLETGGLLLGVFDDAQYEEGEVILHPNDVLVFYTDGFTEISNAEEVEFGDQRLADAVMRHRARTPQLICQALMQEVLSHARATAFEDDATVIVLKRKDGRP